MNWPSHTDYQDSIQNPHICFEEPTLKSAEVGCDMLGLPKVMSGNFASVYSVTNAEGKWAIRCFVRQILGQQGRYARLSQHLFGLGLDFMVSFDYILRGIKVRTEYYPIVKMQWVEGLPLNNYIEEHVNEPETMRSLAVKWRKVMNGLRSHQLAHGDLQHGNVMVTPDGEIRLVDYDGMYTPAFRGKSPELGHANFQHPRRTPDFYNEDLDNFAGLIIYMSFLAIADEPEIFQKFYTGDNLLMLSADYRNPTSSAAFKRLKEHKNTQVKQLAELLEKCCLVDVALVPNFEETIVALEKGDLQSLMPKASSPAPASAAESAGPAGGTGWWAESSTPETSGTRPATPAPSAPAPKPAAQPAAAPKPFPAAPSRPTAPAQPAAASAPKTAYTPSTAKPTAPAQRPQQTTRQPAPQKPAPAPAPQPEPDAGGDNTKMWIMIIGAGVVIFILMFILARFMKK